MFDRVSDLKLVHLYVRSLQDVLQVFKRKSHMKRQNESHTTAYILRGYRLPLVLNLSVLQFFLVQEPARKITVSDISR